MILHDLQTREVKIIGVKTDIDLEFVGIVNALKHQAKMTDKQIMELVLSGLTEKQIFQNIEGCAFEIDEDDFKSVLEKMKKEYETKEKGEE